MTNEGDDFDYDDDSDYEVIDGYWMARRTDQPSEPPETAEPNIRIQETANRQSRPRNDDLWLGKVFTDHMAMLDWNGSTGWTDPRVVPFESLTVHPAAGPFRCGQEIFDGIKAFRGVDGKVHLFRPDRHCQRIAAGACDLGIPAIQPRWILRLLKAFVAVDQAWVPSRPGSALYVRLTLMATEPSLGARPSKQYLLFAIASPTGWDRFPLSPARAWIEVPGNSAPGRLAAIKSAVNYAGRLLVAEDAKARGYHCVLWTGAHEPRHLQDLGTMNLVLVLGDEVVTPVLDGTVR